MITVQKNITNSTALSAEQ